MARTYIAITDAHGAVALSDEARKTLGIHAGDPVQVTVTPDHLEIRRAASDLDLSDLKGVVPALLDREEGDFDEAIDAAMSDHADWVVDRMRRGEE